MNRESPSKLSSSCRTDGYLFTFEGGEGAGKTTLMGLLSERLRATYPSLEVITTFEPGDTPLGARLRQQLLAAVSDLPPIAPRAELLLFLADRAQHVQEIVLPALHRGAIVLCDRFTDSTYAYQGDRSIDASDLHVLCQFAASDLCPDLTFYLDLDPAVGFERVKQGRRLDRIESRTDAFHKRIRTTLQARASAEPERFVVLDGALAPQRLLEQATKELLERTGGLCPA